MAAAIRLGARRIEVYGIRLAVEVQGQGPPLVLLHGFTGNRATWADAASWWPGWRLVAIDLIGHGDSDRPVDSERASMAAACRDLLALIDRLNLDAPVVIGYSMGGRVALHLALAAPERLRALVLESTSPGIEDHAARTARLDADAKLADRIERHGVEAFVREWESLDLFATHGRLPPEVRAALRQQRLANHPSGLATSLRGMGAGTTEPVLDRLEGLRLPTLLVAGADDAKFAALARQMHARLPSSALRLIPAAGHTVHLEQPRAFAASVRAFLNQLSDGSSRAGNREIS